MKTRRKTLTWAALLLGLILAAATAPAVTLDVGDGAGMVGETVLVPVVLADVAAPIWSVELNLVFYYGYASLTGVETTGTLTETWGMSFQGNPGSGHVSFASATPLVGGGVLCYLEFLLLGGNGNALIDLTSAVINEDDLEISLVDGYIQITPIPTVNIYPDNGLLVVGESLEFQTSGGTAPYTYSTSDPAVADFTSGDQFLQALGPGTVQVFTEDADGFTNGTTGLVEVRPFRLNVLDSAGTEGQTVLVPIVIFDPVPYDIVSAEMSATWYANSATFNGVFTGGSLIESFSWSTPVVSSSPGSLFLTTVGVDPLPSSGLFFFLEFTVYNSFTLQLGPGLFNETYQALPQNGQVTVTPLPNLTLTPYTTDMLVDDYLVLTVGGGPALPVVYSTSDSSVLTVSEDGLVHALAAGTSEIWLTDNLGAESNHILVNVYDFSLPSLQSGIHADETVLIPIKVERELDDLDIFSLELGVSFNPYYVEFLGATSTDSATEEWGQPLAVDEGGLAKVYHAGPNALTGCPTGVVYLEFLGLPTIGSVYNGIALHDALFNEGDPRVLINYGDPCIVVPAFDIPTAGLQMLPNHPNPFNPGTTISFQAGQRGGHARLAVYSPRGELVRVLLDQEVAPGSLHQVYWDGRDDKGRLQPSGVYFSRVDVAGDRQMQKMMLIK